jgi:hypothetical protein
MRIPALATVLILAAAAVPAREQATQSASPARATSLMHWKDVPQSPQAAQPPPASPQPGMPPRTPVGAASDYLSRMDADRDGRVSPDEYLDWMSYAFDARDANRDGVLSAGELPGGKGRPVTRGQHRAALAERFRKQDLDRDGYLDAKELAAPPQ